MYASPSCSSMAAVDHTDAPAAPTQRPKLSCPSPVVLMRQISSPFEASTATTLPVKVGSNVMPFSNDATPRISMSSTSFGDDQIIAEGCVSSSVSHCTLPSERASASTLAPAETYTRSPATRGVLLACCAVTRRCQRISPELASTAYTLPFQPPK